MMMCAVRPDGVSPGRGLVLFSVMCVVSFALGGAGWWGRPGRVRRPGRRVRGLPGLGDGPVAAAVELDPEFGHAGGVAEVLGAGGDLLGVEGDADFEVARGDPVVGVRGEDLEAVAGGGGGVGGGSADGEADHA